MNTLQESLRIGAAARMLRRLLFVCLAALWSLLSVLAEGQADSVPGTEAPSSPVEPVVLPDSPPDLVINTGDLSDNTVLRGYDLVAYFTEDRARRGSPDYAYQWAGQRWLFASQEHLELFRSDPQAYLPQYGGYCAWAASNNYIAGVDPEAFDLVGDKLYLNFSKGVQHSWRRNISGNIVKGDRNWPSLRRQLLER